MKNTWKIVKWILSISFILMGVTGGFHLSSFLLLIAGVAALPIAPVQAYWENVQKDKKWIKDTVLVSLVVLAGLMMPKDLDGRDAAAESGRSMQGIQIETVADKDTEGESNQETSASETEESLLAAEKQEDQKNQLKQQSMEASSAEASVSEEKESEIAFHFQETDTKGLEETEKETAVSHAEMTTAVESAIVQTEPETAPAPQPEVAPAPQPEAAPAPQPEAAPAPQPEAAPAPQPEAAPAPQPEVAPAPQPEAAPAPQPEAAPAPQPEVAPAPPAATQGAYAVNAKNGKIHIVGQCPATGDGKNAMTQPVYFNTYEEAEQYSATIESNPDKRRCGNCW